MHIVLFFEDTEYARTITFRYLIQGLKKKEPSFYITAEEDKVFLRNEFDDLFLNSKKIKDTKIKENNQAYQKKNYFNNYLTIEILPNLYEYPNGIGQSAKDILNIINHSSAYSSLNIKDKQIDFSNFTEIDNNGNSNIKLSNTKRTVLRCMHEVTSIDQINKNIEWEKKYRNVIFRKELPNSSIICTYPVNDIIKTIKGDSTFHSRWMAELLEIYDGVIYAEANWKGTAFYLV
jgi:hypothetical protein